MLTVKVGDQLGMPPGVRPMAIPVHLRGAIGTVILPIQIRGDDPLKLWQDTNLQFGYLRGYGKAAPKTTYADIAALATRWLNLAEKRGAVWSMGKTLMGRCVDDYNAVKGHLDKVKWASEMLVYPWNDEFWMTTFRLASCIHFVSTAPSYWDIAVELFEDSEPVQRLKAARNWVGDIQDKVNNAEEITKEIMREHAREHGKVTAGGLWKGSLIIGGALLLGLGIIGYILWRRGK